MDSDVLQALLGWIAGHPQTAGLIIGAIAFTESLVIVGLVMPGAVLLFGAGALLATGALEPIPTLLWASAGALAGDWLSFWIGRRYHPWLRRQWPLRDRPELIERGVSFVTRHGGKGIFLGRFVGPIRPLAPAVAGMLHMPVRRFMLISAVACLVWSPAYLLPGALFGVSVGLASEVGSRLATLLVALLVAVWLISVITRRLYRWLQPRAADTLDRLARWSLRHPILGRPARGLLDPEQPELGSLLATAALLVLAIAAFSALLVHVLDSAPPTPFDQSVHAVLQGLRTPWADRVMIAFSAVADLAVLAPLGAVTAAWLAWKRRWSTAAHWVGALAFALIAPWLLKQGIQIPRPTEIAGLSTFSFPSGHATRATIVFGFLAVLTARDLPLASRWLPYLAAALITAAVAFSRLYLGVHWLSDVAAGVTMGVIWVCLIGTAARRHLQVWGQGWQLSAAALATLAVVLAAYVPARMDNDLARYAPPETRRTLSVERWLDSEWRALPAVRNDLQVRHHHPLTIQWQAAPQDLPPRLAAHGWRPAAGLTWRTSLFWLTPPADPPDDPLLPHSHNGRHEALVLWKPGTTPDRRLVLRLWDSNVRIAGSGEPVLIGNVTTLAMRERAGVLRLPATELDFDAPLKVLLGDLEGLSITERRRDPHDLAGWSGRVVLIRATPATER